MELDSFFPWAIQWVLEESYRLNEDFDEFMSTPNLMSNYASELVMTLPGDRMGYYETSDVSKMRSNVFEVTNDIVETLGFYPLEGSN